MSYPKDLDEYDTAELRSELRRRMQLLAEGRCDYCGRPGTSDLCRFTERHLAAEKAWKALYGEKGDNE
jgi:hypothetical protein